MDEPRSLSDIDSIQSLDTARLALRWALEKIQSLEKDKANVSEKLDSEERARAKTQENLLSLQKTLGLRSAESSQRELYYAKLEEYLSLKLDGKLDPSVLAKRELEVSQLQEMLSQKQAHLEKDFSAKKEAVERDYQRLRTELDAETREKIRKSDASIEARRAAIEQDILLKNSELADKKAELAAEQKVLGEKKARFEEYYNEQRAQLHGALTGFREEIKEEVSLRVQMAERVLEERRESLEKVFSEERSLLIRELESWKAKVKELGPKVIDLDKALFLAEEKILQTRALLDRATIAREEEREIRGAEIEALSRDAELWRKQVLTLLEETQSLKAALSGAENALRTASENIEARDREKKSGEDRMKKELEDFIGRHEALTVEFEEARKRSADQMSHLVELEKENSASKRTALEAELKVSRAQKETECLKSERAALEDEMLKFRGEIEDSLRKSLELERKIGEIEEKLRQEEKLRGLDLNRFDHEKNMWEKEREVLEARLKGYQSKLDSRVKSEIAKASESSEANDSLWPPINWRGKD